MRDSPLARPFDLLTVAIDLRIARLLDRLLPADVRTPLAGISTPWRSCSSVFTAAS
jgi:hypothetical protein